MESTRGKVSRGRKTEEELRHEEELLATLVCKRKVARVEVSLVRSQIKSLLRPFSEKQTRVMELYDQHLLEGVPEYGETDYDDLRIVSTSGRHGRMGRATRDGVEYALKPFDNADDTGLKAELRARKKMQSHPTILPTTGVARLCIESVPKMYLETPYCERGNLLEYVKQMREDELDQSVQNDRIRLFVQQALIGLSCEISFGVA